MFVCVCWRRLANSLILDTLSAQGEKLPFSASFPNKDFKDFQRANAGGATVSQLRKNFSLQWILMILLLLILVGGLLPDSWLTDAGRASIEASW